MTDEHQGDDEKADANLVLGVFTYVRLAEIGVEDMQCLHRIQRIRSYYRELSPKAARFFPASSAMGASGLFQVMAISPRARFQFLFTVAAMVAAINSIVAGVAIALLLHGVVDLAASVAIAVGVAVALVAMTVLMFDERRRYQRMHAAEAAFDEAVNAQSA